MEIKVAKTAGFCFGVNRAVELTYGLLAEGHKVATSLRQRSFRRIEKSKKFV